MMPDEGSSVRSATYVTPGSTTSIAAVTPATGEEAGPAGEAAGAAGARAADLEVGRSARSRPMLCRLVALGLAAGGAGLLPWLVYLAASLPPDAVAWHWPAAWAGLDAMEAAGLISTGVLMLRGDARYRLMAIATAALLAADAWFDVTTAPPGSGELASLLMAALAELPTAAACTWLAFATLRAPGRFPSVVRCLVLTARGRYGRCRPAASRRAPAAALEQQNLPERTEGSADMRTAPPERCCAAEQVAEPVLVVPGRPWAVRLAGQHSEWPAVEVYQAGSLLDVVSSTRLAAVLSRGARAADGGAGPCVLAWGRMPGTGASPEVEFTLGRRGPYSWPSTVLRLTSWCWLAVADGRFDRTAVQSGDSRFIVRIRPGRP